MPNEEKKSQTLSAETIKKFDKCMLELGKKAEHLEKLQLPDNASAIRESVQQFKALIAKYNAKELELPDFQQKCWDTINILGPRLQLADFNEKVNYLGKNKKEKILEDIKKLFHNIKSIIKDEISYKTAEKHMKDIRSFAGSLHGTFFDKEHHEPQVDTPDHKNTPSV